MEILKTERLRLRWFEPGDADFMLRLLNEPSWIENISDPGVRDLAGAQAWMAQRLYPAYWLLGHGFWAVERLADGALIGLCGIYKRASLAHPDLGYAFMPAHWGRGYAREAGRACLAHAREALGLDCVQAITAPGNQRSCQLLLDVGMADLGAQMIEGYAEPQRLFEWRSADAALDDEGQIDQLVARFLAAGSGAGAGPCAVAAWPQWLLSDASLRCLDAGQTRALELRALMLERAELLSSGRLTDYVETELEHETRLSGRVAQRWLRCRKSGRLDGVAFQRECQQSLQLVQTARGWKIAALAWQDQDEGLAPPAAA